MSPSVSVVVPIYNVSQYIERCVRSLFEQTLQDIEYIFVNDCTPDDSITILEKMMEEYPERKKQSRIIHHEKNQGLACSRINGIKVATGKFIIHCDSDDWVDTDLYEKLYNKAEETEADITICDFQCEYDSGKQSQIFKTPISESPRELLLNMHNKSFYCMVWCRLMRRNFILSHNLYPIPGVDMWEDVCVTIPAYYYANKIARAEGTYYHYFINDTSLTANSASERSYQNRKDTIAFLESFFIDKKDGDYHLLISFWKLLAKSYLLQRRCFDPERWKKEYPETLGDIMKIHSFSYRERMLYAVTVVIILPIFLIMKIIKKEYQK